ncbi:MAG: sulfite exporter TauE/SafE family protein [Oscillospiraceae bacterium]|jgi:sulfite exporter TauE/SafE/copper chaperone CopZ|nr:sulfite exporter TauE/SafE family protein [Oscillospiraceae bacterium]
MPETKKIRVSGMTCVACQNKIRRKLGKTAGVKKADVSYAAGTATVTYDTDVISFDDIVSLIEKLNYKVVAENERRGPNASRVVGILIIVVALYALIERFGFLNILAPSRLTDERTSYGMLFVIGLVTSVHCVAMCGGINLSQCIPRAAETAGKRVFAPAFLYNVGRVFSYTAVGFIVGALGSVIAFSNTTQGALKLFAGVFMIIMGINMLNLFPWLRRLNPTIPKGFPRKTDDKKRQSKSPLIVGLLNGFMPCGPLQAMQIYALSAGSPFAGALSMFLFSIGTVPLMFGLGAVTSALGTRFARKVATVGAVLVVTLGLSMFTQGLSLSGVPNTAFGGASGSGGGSDIVIEDGFQIINSTLSGRNYPEITVRAGTPVKWIIDAPRGSINGCNYQMLINEYGIKYTFKYGENVIEFTPDKTGIFQYACWMGMIRSTITVV